MVEQWSPNFIGANVPRLATETPNLILPFYIIAPAKLLLDRGEINGLYIFDYK